LFNPLNRLSNTQAHHWNIKNLQASNNTYGGVRRFEYFILFEEETVSQVLGQFHDLFK